MIGTTTVYEMNNYCTFNSTTVPTIVPSYLSSKVLSYFRTKVLSKVLSYFRKYVVLSYESTVQ